MTPDRVNGVLQTIAYFRQHSEAEIYAVPRGLPEQPLGVTLGEIAELLLLTQPQRQPTQLTGASPVQIQEWSDAIADCTCWFRGYRAAFAAKDDGAEDYMPPNWRTLTEINLAMKAHLSHDPDRRASTTLDEH
jgi:hypothetical protein